MQNNKCGVCNETQVGWFYTVYNVIVITDKRKQQYPLQEFIEELDYLSFRYNYKIDGSKMILLRPDIVKKCLEKECYSNVENLITWFMIGVNACTTCYNKQNLIEV